MDETILPSGSAARQKAARVWPRSVWRQVKACAVERKGRRAKPSVLRRRRPPRSVCSAGSPRPRPPLRVHVSCDDRNRLCVQERECALLTASQTTSANKTATDVISSSSPSPRERPYAAGPGQVVQTSQMPSPPSAIKLPSGRAARHRTWPFTQKSNNSRPVFTSQRYILPSLDPEATRSSDSAATHQT